MGYSYPANLESQPEGGYTVTFDGLPGATEGYTREDALRHAADILETALSMFVDDDKRIPAPEPAHGRPLVSVPALTAAKLALHEAMLDARISDDDLGKRLGTTGKAVHLLRDPMHSSKIETIEAALLALGKRLDVSVREAA